MPFGTADARHETPGIGPLKRADGVAVAASDIALRPHSASFPPTVPYCQSKEERQRMGSIRGSGLCFVESNF